MLYSGPVSSKRPANAGFATTQRRRLHTKDADKINKGSRQTNPQTNELGKVAT